MNPIAEILLELIAYAQTVGYKILTQSGIGEDGVIYAFATADTLVINCKDCETVWRFDEQQDKLNQSIVQLKSSIKNIWIEKTGKLFYQW